MPDTLAIARFLQGLVRARRRSRQFHDLWRLPRKRGWPMIHQLLIPSRRDPRSRSQAYQPVDLNDPEQIQEFVSHSWYDYTGGKDSGPASLCRRNHARLYRPEAALRTARRRKGYSWLKSPRWRGKPVEVGPTRARADALRQGPRADARTRRLSALKKCDLPLTAMSSTLGARRRERWRAKSSPTRWTAGSTALFANIRAAKSPSTIMQWDPATWPSEARGVGFIEAPRGALAHWTSSRTERSTITRRWCHRHGMPDHAVQGQRSPTRRPSWIDT